MTEYIPVGARVKFVGSEENLAYDMIDDAEGIVVGYWDPQDQTTHAPMASTVPDVEDYDSIPYPYYVSGLSRGENPHALPVYNGEELRQIVGSN